MPKCKLNGCWLLFASGKSACALARKCTVSNVHFHMRSWQSTTNFWVNALSLFLYFFSNSTQQTIEQSIIINDFIQEAVVSTRILIPRSVKWLIFVVTSEFTCVQLLLIAETIGGVGQICVLWPVWERVDRRVGGSQRKEIVTRLMFVLRHVHSPTLHKHWPLAFFFSVDLACISWLAAEPLRFVAYPFSSLLEGLFLYFFVQIWLILC